MNIIKIGYFADGPWAHEAFKQLVSDKTIIISFICVRFDRKDPKLLEIASNYGIDVIWSENINSKNFIDKVKTYNVDLFVSMSFNQIFRDEIINLPSLKTINCHVGKLPFCRG